MKTTMTATTYSKCMLQCEQLWRKETAATSILDRILDDLGLDLYALTHDHVAIVRGPDLRRDLLPDR